MQYESRAGGIGVARGTIVLLIFGRYIKPIPISGRFCPSLHLFVLTISDLLPALTFIECFKDTRYHFEVKAIIDR